MDDWVLRAMQRWPNVPALFGWLGLDRRGRWLIKDEAISHPRIVEAISRNYARDEQGRWFFQNGPQRGYLALASAPFVLRTAEDESMLMTHTGLRVARATGAFLDEEGAVVIATEHGPGEILGAELDWALRRLRHSGQAITEDLLAEALESPSGEVTDLSLEIYGFALPLIRLDFADAPAHLNFVRDPQPREGERSATRVPD
ncbi:MAG: DUF2946 family protein [Steroidobacter sp.]